MNALTQIINALAQHRLATREPEFPVSPVTLSWADVTASYTRAMEIEGRAIIAMTVADLLKELSEAK